MTSARPSVFSVTHVRCTPVVAQRQPQTRSGLHEGTPFLPNSLRQLSNQPTSTPRAVIPLGADCAAGERLPADFYSEVMSCAK
jgi:hypothetical protein